MFRALAYELLDFMNYLISDELQQNTMKFMQTFLSTTKKDGKNIAWVREDEIPIFEELIDRNIQVYINFFDQQSEVFAELTRRSC